MELVLAVFAIAVVFFIGYVVGAKQMSKEQYTGESELPSSDEVPTELLGDIEMTLHIAGVKEATPAKIKEWETERKQKLETKTELSIDNLLQQFNKEDLQLKAGINPHNIERATNELAGSVGVKALMDAQTINPIHMEKLKQDSARKAYDKEREYKKKIDFDALNFSRISNEARDKITEIVKNDIENKLNILETDTIHVNNNLELIKKWQK